MYFSKHIELILLGNEAEKAYFQKFFTKVHLCENNDLLLSKYELKKNSVIFLSLEEEIEKSIELRKKLKELNPNILVVLLVEEIVLSELLIFLPLQFSGILKKPFETEKVMEVLQKINNELPFMEEEVLTLKENYTFNKKSNILYKPNNEMTKLTKNETLLMQLLVKQQDFISSETLEHTIWEKDSEYQDCNRRLKHLIYTLRKKLPPKSILNSYKLGYKLLKI
ncbi:MAG TPA: helix-turn-helix domain-containing protein [Arcobacter sp.]|nr:helix-turn-helix domain-containing protein [Arcobacter sp.]